MRIKTPAIAIRPGAPKGVAVVSVMVLVMVCAALAMAAISKSGFAVSRTENQRDIAQARWIAKAAVDYARWVLAADASGSIPAASTLMDHLYEPWAQPIPMTSLSRLFEGAATGVANEDLMLAAFGGRVFDEQSRFNLARLVRGRNIDPMEKKRCETLLYSLGLSESQAAEFMALLQQSLKVENTTGERQPQHRVLTKILDSLAVSDQQRQRLKESIAWLPQPTPVNVNTASIEVIAAMTEGGNRAMAERLVQARERAPLRNLGEINAALAAVTPSSSTDFDVKSSFFKATGIARFNRLELSFEALLSRQGQRVSLLDYIEN